VRSQGVERGAVPQSFGSATAGIVSELFSPGGSGFSIVQRKQVGLGVAAALQ
jgi:hypothetical protein